MKRRNLLIVAILLLTVIVIGTVALFVYDTPGHIACVTYILAAIAFGMIFGFLAESMNDTGRTNKQPSGTILSKPTKRKLNGTLTSILYENGKRGVTEHTVKRDESVNSSDTTQRIDHQEHELEQDNKADNTKVMPKQAG